MPIQYKIDVLQALRDAGWSSFRIRRERIMGQREMQCLREGQPVSWAVIGKLCELLSCQVGDILEYKA